jgi:hypothetical protein
MELLLDANRRVACFFDFDGAFLQPRNPQDVGTPEVWAVTEDSPPRIRISLYQNTQMFGFSQNQM